MLFKTDCIPAHPHCAVSEPARACDVSRTTTYKYIELLEQKRNRERGEAFPVSSAAVFQGISLPGRETANENDDSGGFLGILLMDFYYYRCYNIQCFIMPIHAHRIVPGETRMKRKRYSAGTMDFRTVSFSKSKRFQSSQSACWKQFKSIGIVIRVDGRKLPAKRNDMKLLDDGFSK